MSSPSSLSRRLSRTAFVCTFVLFACDLSDAVVSVGDTVVVVHGVLRPDLPEQFYGRQFIVVELALTGVVSPDTAEESSDGRFHRADSLTIPYGGYPSVPVEGASVHTANLDYPDDPCGSSVQFLEHPGQPVKNPNPGIYWSPQACPTLREGDRVRLTVVTTQGDTVTGVTRIPAMESAYLRVAGDSSLFGSDDVVQFNRDRDTLRIGIEAAHGRLLQFEVRRRGDLTDFGTKIYIDTTTFSLPASVVNTFVIGDEDDVFRAGRNYILSVAHTDTNYFDYSRSRNNTYTGRGFINRMTGGIGVFGSLVALSSTARAIGDINDPREGTYDLFGTYGEDTAVQLSFELYLARSSDTTEFSAFAEGQGFHGALERSIDGTFAGDDFSGILIDTVGFQARADTLRGTYDGGGQWQVIAFSQCGIRDDQGDFQPCSERTIIFRGTMEKR